MPAPDPALRITDRFVFFWGGWPSQWYKARFTIGPDRYNCTEQFMMAEKSRVFRDRDAERDILRSTNPREQKALGRKVRDFDAEAWSRVCRAVVYTANLAKFEQNDDLRHLLLDTAPRIIVEASPDDRIWGIGMGKDDPRAENPDQWDGANWLGIALNQVRDTLEATAAGRTFVPDAELAAQLAAHHKLSR